MYQRFAYRTYDNFYYAPSEDSAPVSGIRKIKEAFAECLNHKTEMEDDIICCESE